MFVDGLAAIVAASAISLGPKKKCALDSRNVSRRQRSFQANVYCRVQPDLCSIEEKRKCIVDYFDSLDFRAMERTQPVRRVARTCTPCSRQIFYTEQLRGVRVNQLFMDQKENRLYFRNLYFTERP